MPAASLPLTGTELMPLVQNGLNVKSTVAQVANYATPIGGIMMFGGDTAPADFLICDGSAVSRITYAGLFSIIGTTYGNGDTTSTFNIPDLRALFAQGASSGNPLGTVQTSNIGSHTHTFRDAWTIEPDAIGLGSLNLDGTPAPPAKDANGVLYDYALYKYDYTNVEENRIRPTNDNPEDGGVNDNQIWTIDNVTNAAGSGELRPANLSLNYIIRAV